MKTLIHIGDVAVCRGEPPNGNPYRARDSHLIGPERKEALVAFKNRALASGSYTYWFAPSCGGARRIEPEEVDWETSGCGR